MNGENWSVSEKKVARRAFDEALATVLAEIMAEMKARAAAATTWQDMWAIEDYLRDSRRAVTNLFDYRYSRLLGVLHNSSGPAI